MGEAASLNPPSPNPAHARVRLAFSLRNAGPATLDVFAVDGRRIIRLVDENLDAGPREIDWDGRDASGRAVASGVYFVRLTAPGSQATRQLTIQQ